MKYIGQIAGRRRLTLECVPDRRSRDSTRQNPAFWSLSAPTVGHVRRAAGTFLRARQSLSTPEPDKLQALCRETAPRFSCRCLRRRLYDRTPPPRRFGRSRCHHPARPIVESEWGSRSPLRFESQGPAERTFESLLTRSFALSDRRCSTIYRRFNMPLELGMALSLRYSGKNQPGAPHRTGSPWFQVGFVHQRFISDLAGFDPPAHDQTLEGVNQ